jgi:FkbM family methyltransferase
MMLKRWFGKKPDETGESALDFLLMSNLNLHSRMEEGLPGNQRLAVLWWDILTRLRPTIFCDIGAHDGTASIATRAKFPDLPIYAFEANPEVFGLHSAALEAQRIRFVNLAISDAEGPARMYAPVTLSQYYRRGRVLPGKIDEPKATAKTSLLLRDEEATYNELNVPGTTLDGFFAKEGVHVAEQRFALWIDVEGAAAKVLHGASGILSSTVAVFIETEGFKFWKDQKDCVHVTQELIQQGFIPIARDREYGDHQFNLLFVKADEVAGIAGELFNRQSAWRNCLADTEPITAGGRAASTSVGSHFQKSMPILIPAFNSVTYLRATVSELRRRGFQNLVVVDNASTFPPMLEYLSQIDREITVIRLRDNRGPRDLFLDRKNFVSLPQYFCITDPDLEFNPALPEDFLCELAVLTEEHQVGKAGFAISLADREKMQEDVFEVGTNRARIWEREAQFWEQKIGLTSTGDEVYRAGIDTTFAVYNKRYFDASHYWYAVRVAGKYTCRHLPWYKETGLPAEEEEYYRAHARFSHYLTFQPRP